MESADLKAFAALDADILMYEMGFFSNSNYGIDRAVSRAHRAAYAFFRIYFVVNKGAAAFGRAFFVFDMRFIFIVKVF